MGHVSQPKLLDECRRLRQENRRLRMVNAALKAENAVRQDPLDVYCRELPDTLALGRTPPTAVTLAH